MRLQGNLVHPVARSFQLVVCSTLLMLIGTVHAQTSSGAGEQTDNLIVEEASGAVKVKLANRWQSPTTGMIVSLPATVSTGADGSLRIRQGATVISIAANTAIELLAGTEPGLPLQRVVQNQGSAFYDIAPRGSSRLRVETPYLVAVIKGTEFNVTVAAETATVALFEGRLLIEAPDVGDTLDLYEGQIARRHKDDPNITVLSMADSEPLARGGTESPAGQSIPGDEGNFVAADRDTVDMVDYGNDPADSGNDLDLSALESGVALDGGTGFAGGDVDTGLDADLDFDGGDISAGLDSGVGIGDGSVNAGIDVGLGLVGGELDVGLEAGLNLGDAVMDVGVDAGLDLGDSTIDLGLDGSIDLGDAVVDVGVDAGLDLADGTIDLGLDGGLDLGDAVVDVGVDAGLDLADGTIDLGLDGDVDLGDIAVDAGLDAAVDLGDGDIDLGLDGDVDLGGDALVDAGLDAGVDLDDGNVDVGLDVGMDAGLDDTAVDAGIDTDIDLGDGDIAVGLDGNVDLPVASVDVDVGADIDLGDLDNLVDLDLDLDLDLLGDDESDSDDDAVEDDDSNDLPINPGDLLDLLGL